MPEANPKPANVQLSSSFQVSQDMQAQAWLGSSCALNCITNTLYNLTISSDGCSSFMSFS